MGTKEKIITLLEENRDRYFSGESIAQLLGVSRAAVWKAVKNLEVQGYPIDAVPNRGYRLASDCDILSAQGISSHLTSQLWNIHTVDSLDSTNSQLRTLASRGEAEGYVLAANTQTDGRGRMGRQFFSPENTGIYFSLLLRPRDLAPDQAMQLTTMAAAAICQAIAQLTETATQIKWVNDILLNGRKVCGILTEASFNLESGFLDYAVVGLGINLYPPKSGFPQDISETAGYLCDVRQPDLKNRLIARFLDLFSEYYMHKDFSGAAKVYRDASLLVGKQVLVLQNEIQRQAEVLDITPRCQLLVRYENGETQTLSYGEVRIVNQI